MLFRSKLLALVLINIALTTSALSSAVAQPVQELVAEVVVTDGKATTSTSVVLQDRARGRSYELRKDKESSAAQSRLLSLIQSGNRVHLYAPLLPPQARAVLLLRDRPSAAGHARIESISPGESNLTGGVTANGEGAAQNRSLIVFTVAWSGYASVANSAAETAFFTGGTSADRVLMDSSYNKLGFKHDNNNDGRPDVFGPITVDRPADPCDWNQFSTMAAAVDTAARAQGIDASLWQHKAYVLPGAGMSCSFVGRAHIGCSASYCLSQYDGDYMSWTTLFIHELGHNLGQHHAATDPGDDGVLDVEYGDHSCWMGNPNATPANNVAHRVQSGWLSGSNIADGSAGGNFRVSALDIVPGLTVNPHTVRIPIGSEYYYISYRRPGAGTFDTNLGSSYVPRVSLHRHGGAASQTKLLGTLAAGEARTLGNGYRLSVQSISSDYADINIAGDCATAAPTLSISPSTQTTALAGGTLAYTVTLTNRDSSFCGASTFNLVGTPPGVGWSMQLDSASLQIAAGGSASTQVRVVSATGAADASYSFTVTAQDPALTSHRATGSGAYVLDATPEPPASVTAKSVQRGGTEISWSASTSPQVTSYEVYESVNSGAYGLLGSTSQTKLVKSTALTCGLPYRYYVVSVNSYGRKSVASGIASITVACKGRK